MRIDALAKTDKPTAEDRDFYRKVVRLRKRGMTWAEVAAELKEAASTIYARATRLHDRIRAARKR